MKDGAGVQDESHCRERRSYMGLIAAVALHAYTPLRTPGGGTEQVVVTRLLTCADAFISACFARFSSLCFRMRVLSTHSSHFLLHFW